MFLSVTMLNTLTPRNLTVGHYIMYYECKITTLLECLNQNSFDVLARTLEPFLFSY